MKKHLSNWLWLIAVVSIFASCKKDKELTELEKLPPTTQTGANTFGCLVNGKAWVAQRNDCNILCDPSFKLFYDPSGGGSLSIFTYQILTENNINNRITISFDSTNFKDHFIFQNDQHLKFSFTDYAQSGVCADFFSLDGMTSTTGKVFLTNYNLVSGIISGTFEFTLTKTGCPDITVTEGRFDKKL